MRYVIGVLLLCLLSAGSVQAQPSQQVIIEETLRVYPGVPWSQCFTVPRSILVIQVSSVGDRATEPARLLFRPDRQTVRPESYLATPLGVNEIVSAHTVEEGAYCYDVSVRGQYVHIDPSSAERLSKSVSLRVMMTPLP